MFFGLYLQSLIFVSRPPHPTHSTTETNYCLKWDAKTISTISDVQILTTERHLKSWKCRLYWMTFFRNRGSGIIRNGVSSGKTAPAVAIPSTSSSTVKSSVNNRIYSGTGIRVPAHHGHTGRLLSEVDEEIEQNGGEENSSTRPRLSSSSFPTNCQRSR